MFVAVLPGCLSALPGVPIPSSASTRLSALAINLSSLPEELSRKLPRHPVPCGLIGRLAVDQSVRGHGLGRMLLVDAIKRTMGASDVMAIHAVIVDAKNNAAKQFYEGFGFAPMQDDPMRLFLPLGSIPSLRCV